MRAREGHGHYLQRRGSRYRFRMRLPRGLVPFVLPGELMVNLATTSRATALRRARNVRLAADRLMDDLTRTLDPADARARISRWVDDCSTEWETRIALNGVAFLEPEEAASMGQADALGLDMLLRIAAQEVARPAARDSIMAALSGLSPVPDHLEPVVLSALGSAFPGVARESPLGRFVVSLALRGWLTVQDEATRAERGDLDPIPRAAPVLRPGPARVQPAPAAAPRGGDEAFLAHWEAFAASKVAEGCWGKETVVDAPATPRLFAELMGDVTLAGMTREVASTFRAELLTLPAKYA